MMNSAIGSATPARNPAWLGAVVMVCLALLSLAGLAKLEFGVRSHEPIQVDELYFATCAARGLSENQFPVAGCHDNKGPMIYWVHQLVQLASSTYNLVAIKLAAYLNVALLTVAAAWLAYRLSGALAATAASAFLLSALAVSSGNLALKTELLGGLFLLLALVALLARKGRRPTWALISAGSLLGLAVLSRQTYAVALPALLLGIYLSVSDTGEKHWVRPFMRDSLKLMAGLLAPFGLFLLWFYLRGQEREFLANLFVYPAVRNVPSNVPLAKVLQWELGSVLSELSSRPALCTLFALQAGAVVRALRLRRDKTPSTPQSQADARQLPLIISAGLMFLVILVSPVFYPYHALPVLLLMAPLAGIGVAELSAALFTSGLRNAKALITISLCTPALLMAANSWSRNGSANDKRRPSAEHAVLQGEGRGEHAFVLGIWPSFFVYNDLIPASNLMFPWALVGAPPSSMYGPPPAGSLRASMLHWAQESMEASLIQDFRRTPPRFIAVVSSMARSTTSKQITDVKVINDYLLRHCSFQQHFIGDHDFEGELYRCRTAGSELPEPSKPAPVRQGKEASAG